MTVIQTVHANRNRHGENRPLSPHPVCIHPGFKLDELIYESSSTPNSMPRECSDGLGRRSVLQTLGAMSVGGTAGCSGLFSDDQPEHVTDSPVDNDQPEHATDSPVDDDQPEHDTAWPMFRYDRRHTGFTNIGGIGIPASVLG